MKNGIKIIVSLSIIFLLLSCNKRRQVDIEGRVYNPVTQEGIAGAELWLLKSGPITEFYGGYERVETVYSDANGNFKVNVKSAKAEILRLGDMHGEYYNIGWYKNGSKLPSDLPVQQGKNMKADFYAVPYGGIQLNINNVNCLNSDDYFVLYAEGIQVDNSINGFMTEGFGCYQYNPNSYTKVPMGKRYYRYEVTRNNITNIFYDTIFIGAGENKIYEINY